MHSKIDIGISDSKRNEIAQGLSKLLADTYTLYLKTLNFHWNVMGPLFQTLHVMFEEQYRELAEASDRIAERIRALGLPAPASYSQFSQLTTIKEETGVPTAEEMIQQLLDGHENIIRTIRAMFPLVSDVKDEATVDLLTDRMEVHEKKAWMLRSTLGK